MIKGLVGSKYQTVFCTPTLFADAQPLINLINRSDEYFIINGVKSTIYDLMLAFSSFEPKSLTRYKGLGRLLPHYTSNSVMKTLLNSWEMLKLGSLYGIER
jgi:hypothetical protein